jgi:four helix bundle protein
MLDYERLDVYQCAIEHLAFVFRSIANVPRGYSALVDQWRRASMSVPLNIAEAVGKTSEADRNNRYAIARGEAMECGAIIDVVRLLHVLPEPELVAAKQLLIRVVGMLSKLCR